MANSFKPANILIPQNADMQKWSVVACDQFTSEPEYWKQVEENIRSFPSTYNLIFPEVYLYEGDERISVINQNMRKYIDEDVFSEFKDTYFYVKRVLKNGKIRRGIIGCVDLEDYCFEKGSESNIRATEGTIIERIPPRVKIRKDAPLEFPHIMILIDDPEKTVIEPLDESINDFDMVYDFDLMQNGGHITGYNVSEICKNNINSALDNLNSQEVFNKKYSIDAPVLTYAVGDGNHSLATAKTCWETIKQTLTAEEIENHPARFALAELVNLHDLSLEFEPIHRVVFGVNPEKMYEAIFEYYPLASETDNGGKKITAVFGNTEKNIWIKDDKSNLAVGTLQNFIDNYLKENDGKVDYIHGDKVVRDLGSEPCNIGFLLPAMEKSELYKTVILDGALPRKTFSMGEAEDKRYYLEGKKII